MSIRGGEVLVDVIIREKIWCCREIEIVLRSSFLSGDKPGCGELAWLGSRLRALSLEEVNAWHLW